MATIVNNPAPVTNSGGGSSFLIGVIIVVGFVMVIAYVGFMAVRRMGPAQVNIPTPQVNIPAPQVVIPDKINVNVTQDK